MALADLIAARTGNEASALPWLMSGADPRRHDPGVLRQPRSEEIGMNLERYYPGYTPPPKLTLGKEAEFNSWSLLSSADDAARDPFELRRAGHHDDRHVALPSAVRKDREPRRRLSGADSRS